MVVMLFPATWETSVEHERTAAPSTCTVQAPQRPAPQPNFVPLSSNVSRSTQSRGVCGVTLTLRSLPFTRRVISAIWIPIGRDEAKYRTQQRGEREIRCTHPRSRSRECCFRTLFDRPQPNAPDNRASDKVRASILRRAAASVAYTRVSVVTTHAPGPASSSRKFMAANAEKKAVKGELWVSQRHDPWTTYSAGCNRSFSSRILPNKRTSSCQPR